MAALRLMVIAIVFAVAGPAGAVAALLIDGVPAAADSTGPAEPVRHPNPTRLGIQPLRGQTGAEQRADERACYADACAQTAWDPYDAWADLAAAGYAVALPDADMMDGLVCLAGEGAMTGEVAADLLDEVIDDPDDGAETGAGIAIAAAVIRSDYLRQRDDPAARRAITRYERDLRQWERRFSAGLRAKGYRVSPR